MRSHSGGDDLLRAYINSVEYNALWDFSISEQTGNKTSTEISVEVDGQPFPVSGDIIELKDGETTLFWGTCGIPKSPEYQTGLERNIYTITCGNANTILAYRIANVAYQNYSITEIVQALYDKYIAEEGITLASISNIDVSLEVYTAADRNLQDALNELADLVGAVWEVTPDREFYFVVEENFPVFSEVISPSFLLGSGLQHTTKDYKMRTVQYISGATDYTSQQTEIYTYTEDIEAFNLVFPVANRPAISVNGDPVPTDKIGIAGIDDDTPGIAFLFTSGSATVQYVTDSEYLSIGDKVLFSYIGIFPIRISVSNSEKIAEIAEKTGTSGRREMVQIANDISTQSDAVQLAQSLLKQFETYTGEVNLWLLSDQLYRLGMSLNDVKLLTQITFDLPAFGVSGKYVIVERTLSPAYADMSDAERKFRVDLRMVDRDYIKSYGETISDLRRDINQLSIRAEDIVISVESVIETLQCTEEQQYNMDNAYYATTQIENGSLFAPCDLGNTVYPAP